jgi:hypothetical protein
LHTQELGVKCFLLDGCFASIVIELDADVIKELQMKINKQSKINK